MTAGMGQDPDQDSDGFRYAQAVVEEALRLYPPAWSIVRDAITDDEIDGHPIPAGSVVITSPYVTHRDPQLWPMPQAFCPERFLADSPDRPEYAYFPFGAGVRHCVGNRMALRQASTVIAALASRFALVATSSAPATPVPAVTLRPSHAIMLRLSLR